MRLTGLRIISLVSLVAALAVGAAAPVPTGAQTQSPPAPLQSEEAKAAPEDAAAQPSTEPEKKKNFTWKNSWEGWDGLHYQAIQNTHVKTKVESRRGGPLFDLTQVAFAGKFGGKFALDAAAFGNVQNLGAVHGGSEVRRARIYMTGDAVLFAPWSFRIELGRMGKNFTTEESYFQLKNFPKLGVIQFGLFQAPMGLEAIMAARDTTFMEPPSAIMALAPGANQGIQVCRPAFKERMTWTLGLFVSAPTADSGDATKEARRAIGRLTWLAMDREEEGAPKLLHLGASGSILYSGSDSVQYRSRPESHLAPYMVATGQIKADGATTLGLEGAWVSGPICVQGEALSTRVNSKSGDSQHFGGYYVSASWFLTGESRPYSKQEGLFTRVRPFHNLSWKRGGRGALEVAARYSVVDLNSGVTSGGKMRSLAAGLNWYLNPNSKMRLNLVTAKSDRQGIPSKMNIAELRIEFDF